MEVPMTRRLEQARDALMSRQRAISTLCGDQASREDALALDRGGDVADEAAIVELVAGLELLLRGEQRELAAIEVALARIAQGSYGLCESCRRRIDPRRLSAIPWTPLCRTCRGRAEGRQPLTR
jgi:RNA polymerase-binding transcription factor DksA